MPPKTFLSLIQNRRNNLFQSLKSINDCNYQNQTASVVETNWAAGHRYEPLIENIDNGADILTGPEAPKKIQNLIAAEQKYRLFPIICD